MLLEEEYERRLQSPWGVQRKIDGVIESDTSLRIDIDLPGVEAERIHVEADGTRVKVRVERSMTFVGDEDTLYMVDDRFSGYERMFSLPVSADVASAHAYFSRNRLSIVVPKRRIRRSIPVEETMFVR